MFHACYFGRVYYWLKGLEVVSYSFEPRLKTVPRTSFCDKDGKKITVGGYAKRSKRYRAPIRGKTFNIATDFQREERFWWEGWGLRVPDAGLFTTRRN